MRTWKVIDPGEVGSGSHKISYTCMNCGLEALLPVKGLAMAQIGTGVVFDVGGYAMPRVIQCRACKRRYEMEDRHVR